MAVHAGNNLQSLLFHLLFDSRRTARTTAALDKRKRASQKSTDVLLCIGFQQKAVIF